MIFEAEVGEPGRGDVAVDTVRLSPGPCVITPGVAALDKYTGCSFNTDMCGYLAQNVPSDPADTQAPAMWSRVRGATGRFPPGHRTPDGGPHTEEEEDWYDFLNCTIFNQSIFSGTLCSMLGRFHLSTSPLKLKYLFYF